MFSRFFLVPVRLTRLLEAFRPGALISEAFVEKNESFYKLLRQYHRLEVRLIRGYCGITNPAIELINAVVFKEVVGLSKSKTIASSNSCGIYGADFHAFYSTCKPSMYS